LSWAESEKPLIPLHRGMHPMNRPTAKIDLLLAPDLYLMKREELPVRFAFEARKIAPAILEELGAGEGWQFEALRDGPSWLLFAYDPQQIAEVLREAGIRPPQIHRLYFAQQFRDQLSHPLALDSEKSLVDLNGTVTLIPRHLQGGDPLETTLDLSRPASSFSLRGIQNPGTPERSVAMMLAALLVLLGLAWSIEGWHFHRAAAELKKPLDHVLEGHPALASSITRRNIYQRYRQLDQPQRRLRTLLQRLGTLIGKDARLTHLSITPQSYEVRITVTPQRIATVKKLALQQGFSPRIEGETLLLQGALK